MDDKALLDKFSACRKLLVAIGNETRQGIIAALACADCEMGMRVGEITEKTHLSRPAVSHHVKILRDTEVIGLYPQGTMNYYYLKLGGAWGELVALVNHIEGMRGECGEEEN
ncbi:MAG: ArsR family transcriptional regulator [Clostridiales Family XIII bacterium]|jgi:ArsR family transcriptional regulator|nr:ArsR family transcriptional regulator [Clostridiales Family XIII bacterium]